MLYLRSYLIVILVFNVLFLQSQKFEIATFNIQNLGKSKMAKVAVVDTLVAIVKQFDIVAVQEISDIENKTALAFLKAINASGEKYKVICSPRTGQQPDDIKSAEQYAFYFDSKTVKLLAAKLYPDKDDDFQREPYIATFMRKADSLTFVLCTIHTAPDRAVAEIAALEKIALWIKNNMLNADNMLFCGDFNASCSYASDSELNELSFRKKPYVWIVPDDADTNLAKKKCAYDRFVVNEHLNPYVINWYVHRAFKSKTVSDHWPVVLELSKSKFNR